MNKGDVHSPEVRCRLVAQEVNTYKEDAFFAATPPLEALRLVLSHVATGTDGRKIMILDAKKAHLHAYAEREMFVELPPERRRPGFCGRLVRSLYGTRDAPSLWEKFAASQLEGLGFIRGLASSCVFRHASRDFVAVVHGDDFVFAGVDADLAWAHSALKENILLKKVGTLSGDAGDVQEIRVLNRVLRWTEWGIAYEADPRHAELLIQALGPNASQRTTPGLKPTSGGPGDQSPLSWAEARLYRACAARANYLALDRVDVAFAAKELCRRMSSPVWADLEALRRLAQYLVGVPRLVWHFAWQQEAALHAFVDTDYAGCHVTRRSTSGGMIFRGAHIIKHWAVTQKHVTLSSGEAELGGVVKGAAEGLGVQSLALDMGLQVKLAVHADSSAAIGICRRSGIGSVRHLAVGQLWVQERIRQAAFTLHKVRGDCNPADLCTKHLGRATADHLLRIAGLHFEAGRASSAPLVSASVELLPASR